ncbi:HigA family addiction module antitoxin [Mobiluncus mulieris]|uniref:HigA family addiction module antidote protein n=2 Tax=Mobiluncus mulieris TaxID=2052 RepID=A0A2X1S0B3_9ACTO|nr:HigA family addiction module antitoxin [Mobiluncus mulieris]EEJ54590.1 addiction module antidote protein HigA [Mobiluncus mulieris ATCC 35243]MCU9969669.1 HigA family addiction module antidote protein [Mobiluncus mulieris]MCU9973995.1 HigA family addiction module antidote protein [Mobiluncus mulieris]MCU9995895.1 HigA family addiction module antidote protein [Mobiluncus mulieris]MCV0010194.1 HigA family addiction module antidote protein [Mobiluncus mulieris]
MVQKAHPPIHPGEILWEEFLKPLNISQYWLAKTMGVPPRRINEIVHGKRRITVETGLLLSRALGTSDGFWTGLQLDYDNAVAREALASDLAAITPLVA